MPSLPHAMVADPYGDHQVGCGGNGDRIFRHNALCDAAFSAAQSAALAPWKEMPSLIPNSRCRPADVFLPSWKGGRPAALDMTVISTMQQATIQGAASTQGKVMLHEIMHPACNGSYKLIEHDIALTDYDYCTGCVGEVCCRPIMFQAHVHYSGDMHPIYTS